MTELDCTMTMKRTELLERLDQLSASELRAWLAQELTQKRLGLAWERDAIEHDKALNGNIVLPAVSSELSHFPECGETGNLIIEGDNFDSLRLLRSTHAGKVRVIYIDPPYNTGAKDWVYNDAYVSKTDRWKHSKWLEFLYQRLLIARELLAPDGVMLISINDENRSRLELLLDEVMPGRRLGTMVWRTRQGSNANQAFFMSADHEHILVYGNPGFSFHGFEKTYDMYSNDNNDPRGAWRLDNLTLGYSYKERPNLYYPLKDPDTGIYYPPNPDRVWVYATEKRLKPGQKVQAKTMEEFISLGQVAFPDDQQRVAFWKSMDDLLMAIDCGDVPKSGKTPLLRRGLPDLERWVGVPVGFGRPQFKRYKADLKNQRQPLSSWIVPRFEMSEYDAPGSFVSTTNKEGANGIAEIFGSRVFNYAKPLTLLRHLLDQATGPDDIVLDFFAGSGTTGHAVMELNEKDGGNRKFILCSSTEATKREPDKNICRDICAERIRRVLKARERDGISNANEGFAYLSLDLVEEADLDFEGMPDHASALVALRKTGLLRSHLEDDDILVAAEDETAAILICRRVTEKTLSRLSQWPAQRLVIYSPRPDSVRSALAEKRTIDSYPLDDAFRRAQSVRKAFEEVVE
ncbi:site-specific DNA-methyltransferase [Vreelandella olivaria]|uniref:site-specific DNA-methyltransferase n=1 Tax=Vreelandella olivaria TaxID=390919 RepID=UPI00201F458B|nr:site-specific DNA-methyltransferase [Halomonas olivaria]